ncbi:hypothetical protein V6Z12_A01G184500 [Gossypium hirsutum]
MFTNSKLHACCCFSFSKHISANGWSTFVDSTWWWCSLHGIVVRSALISRPSMSNTVSKNEAPNCHIKARR